MLGKEAFCGFTHQNNGNTTDTEFPREPFGEPIPLLNILGYFFLQYHTYIYSVALDRTRRRVGCRNQCVDLFEIRKPQVV